MTLDILSWLRPKKAEPKTATLQEVLETNDGDLIEKWENDNIPRTGNEISYVKTYWGHTISCDRKIGDFGFRCSGFYSGNLGKRMKVGDTVLMRFGGGRIGRLLVAEVKYSRDPSDLYRATLIGVLEYVEN